jgi:hypothetical protein
MSRRREPPMIPPGAMRSGQAIGRRTFVRTASGLLIAATGLGACGETTSPPPPPNENDPDPATCTVTASQSSVAVGAASTLTLTARDSSGVRITTGGATVVFTASGGTSTGTISATTDHDDGTYTALYTGTAAGTAQTIAATINGEAVTTTMPTITVTAQAGQQPVVAAVSPNIGDQAGGLVILITGSNFTGATGVTIGGAAATNLTVASDAAIACVTPAHAVGPADVVVTNGSNSGTLAGGYTFLSTPDALANLSFETGWDGFTDGGTGNPTAGPGCSIVRATDQAYSGNTSLKYTWAEQSGNSGGACWHTFAPQDAFWFRFYARLAGGWSIQSIQKWTRFSGPGFGANLGGFYLDDNRGLTFNFDQEASAVGATIVGKAQIPVDQWHSIEVHYRRNGDSLPNAAFYLDGLWYYPTLNGDDPSAPNYLQWIDGRLYPKGTRGSTSQVGTLEVCGTLNGGSGSNGTGSCWIDRLAISSLGRIGP